MNTQMLSTFIEELGDIRATGQRLVALNEIYEGLIQLRDASRIIEEGDGQPTIH